MKRTVLSLTVMTLFSVPTWSQSKAVNATLSGRVADPNGAPVPGARVSLDNPESSFHREFVTPDSGQFTFTLAHV